jgi:hypothetical protein
MGHFSFCSSNTSDDDEEEDYESQEDEDEESGSLMPRYGPTTKSEQQTEEDNDSEEDYDSEEDEDDALERDVSWKFWSNLAREKQSVPPPKFTGDVQRTLDPPPTGAEPPPMFPGMESNLRTPDNTTCDSEPDSSLLTSRQPQSSIPRSDSDADTIKAREKRLQQLQFLQFSGDSEDEDEEEDEEEVPVPPVSQSNPSSKLAGRPPCDRPRSHKEPGKEDTKTQEAYQESEKKEDSEDEDEDGESVSSAPQACPITKSDQAQQKEVVIEKEDYDKEEDYDSEEEDSECEDDEPHSQPENLGKRKQTQDQALEKEDEESPEEYSDSEDEDEDEVPVPVSPVPHSGSTTKSNHAQQKEVVIEERDYDKAEDYDSEEDEEDALKREVSWSFWSSLARRKQSVPPPKFMEDERRALGPTGTHPGPPAMSTGDVESTSDGPPTNSNREPDSKSIRMREKFLHQLQFLKFSGDRDTQPSTVDWFLQLVAEYVRLGGGVGVSQDDRLINTVLENLSREPRGGKDRAYRWAISWIGSRSGQSIYTVGSYAWVINYGTGKNVYTPPSTVPVHQHYPFSWIEFVDAFMDEFDPERRGASQFRKNAFDRGRRESNMFRGAESDWRGAESTRFNSGARDSSRFHEEAFDRRGKDSRRGQPRSEQSTVALQAQQRRCDRGPQHNDNLREGSAFRYRSREPQKRSAVFEQHSARNTEQPNLKCSTRQLQSLHECRDSSPCKKDSEKVLVLEERVALLEKHVACLERELKAIHTKSSTVSIAPEKAQKGLSHCCRVCPQTFESSTQLHRHLRNSKHFTPPPSPASSSEDVRESGSSAAPSPNEDVPYMILVAAEPPFLRTSSGSVPASVPVATPEVYDGEASEDFIPAGPFSSTVLTASSRAALQAKLPNLAGLNGEIQLKANTGNHAASESDWEAALKPKRVAPKAALAETRSLPVSADAGTTKWKKEAENQKALATKWCDRYNTIRELACKIPGYNDPKLAALDADPAELQLLPANADANKWQKKAEDWRFLATEWRSRYTIVEELALKISDCKATDVPPPQKISLQVQTCLLNDYRVEPKPTIVTASDKDFGKIAAASVDLPVVEDYVNEGAVTKMSASASGKSVMGKPSVHEKPMVTRFSTSAPPNFAAALTRTKPTAAVENNSFLPFYRPLPSSIPLLGY